MVGGLLVALAMLASFAVATGRDRGPRGQVVVVRRAVPMGARLDRASLAVEPVDLPSSMAGATFRTIAEVEGAVALNDLAPGDPVERSALSFAADPPDRQVSFPVERARALDGHLQPGEAVDVLATYGTGETARTLVVARRVRLVDVDVDTHQGLDSSGKIVVTVALRDPDTVLATTHAAGVAAITLIRATGSTRDGADSYSLPADASGPDSSSASPGSGSPASG